jgi:mannose-1-phosphate guanylyltransferase
MYLASQVGNDGVLATGANIKGNCIIDATAIIDPSAEIGPDVVIGAGCKVGAGSKIVASTLMAGVIVKEYSLVSGSIIGWKSTIGKWCRVTGLTVIAEDVQVGNETYLNGTKVLPHKGVNGVHPTEGTIIM